MPQVTFQQGEDRIIELTVIENSVPVDLSTATSIRVQLFIAVNNVKGKFASYSSTSKSGYGNCRVKSGVTAHNIIEVLVTRAESINFGIGALSFAAVVTMPGGTDFSNGKNDEYDFDNYGTVIEGQAKTEVIP